MANTSHITASDGVDDVVRVVELATFLDEAERATSGDAVAAAMGDLDGFGTANEVLGREAADAILRGWVRTLTGSLPGDAVVRRIGGDEFAVALPGRSAESALIVLDEVRQHLQDHPIDRSAPVAVTVTFGVAARPPHATQLDDVVRCASAALMRGKREGGNRVAMYVEEKMVLKSNYYPRADLDRLNRLAAATGRTEASLLREALEDLMAKHRETF